MYSYRYDYVSCDFPYAIVTVQVTVSDSMFKLHLLELALLGHL